MIKKLLFNNQLDLNACTGGQLLRIFLIRKLYCLLSGNQKKQLLAMPQWSELVLILLIHRCYPVFPFLSRWRSIFSQWMKRQ